MRKILFYIGFFILLISIASCRKDTDEVDPDISDSTDGYAHEEASDYIWDENSVLTINLNGTSIESSADGVLINGTIVTIQKTGNYKITGTLNNGQVIIDTDTSSVIRIILNNCNVTNSTGPAILVQKSKKTIINIPFGTVNTLEDGPVYTNPTDDPNATLFSKSDVTIFGEGSLNVIANFQDGISSKDGLIIKSGIVNIVSKDDGLCGKDYLIIHDINLQIESQGDGIRSDDASNSAVGYILIDAGTFKIESAADGITAVNYINIAGGNLNLTTGGGSSITPAEISCKGIKSDSKITLAAATCNVNSSEDAIHSKKSVEIISGSYTLQSAKKGINADDSVVINSDLTITKCEEGIESKFITVNHGNVVVISSDDSFNATAGQATENDDQSCIYINGGTIVLNGSNGDALDSNGSILLTDGKVIIHGPNSAPEVALDYNGTFKVNGGLLIASGTNSNMTQPPSESSSQNSIKITFRNSYPASTLFHIRDSEGNELVTFKPERQFQSMIFSSASISTGVTYYIYVSGSYTGNEEYGFFSGGTYTPGTELTTFTVSGKITSLNNI